MIVVVGLKAPGIARGIWRGQFLIIPAGRNAARERVQQVSGVTILQESASLPALEVKIRSLQALSALRALPVIDYVEPAVMEISRWRAPTDMAPPAPSPSPLPSSGRRAIWTGAGHPSGAAAEIGAEGEQSFLCYDAA
jgi:hypothetical protein